MEDIRLLTNSRGHGLDHMMINKEGKLLIAETKANTGRLSKGQSLGGEQFLIDQLIDLNKGYKGKGRYKNLHKNEQAKKAIKKMEKTLKSGNVEYAK